MMDRIRRFDVHRRETEDSSPVWCRSAHTRLIDPTINDALRIVTGFLRPTLADNLPTSQASNLLSFVAKELHCL